MGIIYDFSFWLSTPFFEEAGICADCECGDCLNCRAKGRFPVLSRRLRKVWSLGNLPPKNWNCSRNLKVIKFTLFRARENQIVRNHVTCKSVHSVSFYQGILIRTICSRLKTRVLVGHLVKMIRLSKFFCIIINQKIQEGSVRAAFCGTGVFGNYIASLY